MPLVVRYSTTDRGAPFGEIGVVSRVALVVGVAGDLDLEDLRVVLHRRRDGVEHQEALFADESCRCPLANLMTSLILISSVPTSTSEAPVGAAVLVLEAVVVLGLVGALVVVVGDAVLVAIGDLVGAAVLVLEAVLDLGLVDALVVVVRDAVAVVVGIGAAVGVLEAVGVLGVVGALVDLVGDAVFVVSGQP